MLAGKGTVERPLAGELFGSLYYREGNLKLLGLRPWAMPGQAPQATRWQLFDVARDRGEVDDLAAREPEVFERLKRQWQVYAKEVGVAVPPRQD